MDTNSQLPQSFPEKDSSSIPAGGEPLVTPSHAWGKGYSPSGRNIDSSAPSQPESSAVRSENPPSKPSLQDEINQQFGVKIMPGDGPQEPSSKKEAKEQGWISRIHTFRGDVEQFVQEKGVTLSSLLAQKQKKVVEAPRIREGRPKIIWIAGIVLLLAIGGAAFYFLRNRMTDAPIVRPDKPASLYPFFDDRVITVRNSPSDFIPTWQSLLLRSIPQEQMLGVYVFSETKNKFLGPSEWFDFLGIALPPSFRAALGNSWALGILGTSQGSEPVFLIPVTSFEFGLAGMLAWEQDQPLALRNILSPSHPQRKFEKFQDAIIENQDVRFLKNDQGQEILAYSFFNRKILILTTSLRALEQVIERFLVVPPSI